MHIHDMLAHYVHGGPLAPKKALGAPTASYSCMASLESSRSMAESQSASVPESSERASQEVSEIEQVSEDLLHKLCRAARAASARRADRNRIGRQQVKSKRHPEFK